MANNLESNVSTRVAKVFAKQFESNVVVTKTVDKSTIAGSNGVTNETGDTVYLKRAPQYKAIRTADGDITNEDKNAIGIGRIAATVRDFITVPIDYTNLEQVTELNQLEEILRPAADELVNTLEQDLINEINRNSGLVYGTPGTPVTTWKHVAGAGALMSDVGVPNSGERFYIMNNATQIELAAAQSGLNGSDQMIRSAWENAQISGNFGGLKALTSNALGSFTSGEAADRVGALASTPSPLWSVHKDTMIQTLALTGLTVSTVDAVRPGDILEFTGRHYINVKNRQVVRGPNGLPVPYRMTVVTGGDTNAAGEVTVTATNAAIYDTAGTDTLSAQYQTIDSPLTSGDVVTILGDEDTQYQANLFYHKSAIVLASLPLPKLYATDTLMTTKDGLKMRITKYSDGDANAQRWRIDMLPVIGVVNPLFLGRAFGVPA